MEGQGQDLNNLTPEQLVQRIQETGQKMQVEKDKEMGYEPPVTIPPHAQGDKVEATEMKPVVQEQPAEQAAEPPKKETPVEQQPAAKSDFADLQTKKGFQSKEDLAKAYKNLEKEFHKKRQEEARTLRQTAPTPESVSQPEEISASQPQESSASSLTGYNKEQFFKDLERDPLGTFATINRILNNDLVREVQDQRIHSKVVELSSNPKTAEFNLPEVQDEMKKVWDEHPKWCGNVAKYLDDVYYIARGRMGPINKDAVEAGKKMAEQAMIQKQAAIVETSSAAPIPSQPVSPEQMSPNDLWNLIEKTRRGLVNRGG